MGRNGLKRYNTDGTVDAGFMPNAQVNIGGGIALQQDGKIIIGGSVIYIQRLNPDGTIDGSFYPPVTGIADVGRQMVIQPDGKLIIGGITNYDGYNVRGLARILTASCTSTVAPTINITASPSGSVCSGTVATFTATNTNGGSNPGYQWQVNGAYVIAANSATYSNNLLNDGDVVRCVLNAHATCLSYMSDTSNRITVSVTERVAPSVSIALTTGTLPVCIGSPLTFTATLVNGGTAPAYQWTITRSGNSFNAGTNAATFTYNSVSDIDIVSCMLTSNATCVSPATAASNAVQVQVNTFPSNWYLDADGDGYAASSYLQACSSPGAGYTSTVLPVGDCDDNNAAVHQEFLFFFDADHDGYGGFTNGFVCAADANTPPLGYSLTSGECNDNDPTVWQFATVYFDGDGDGFYGSLQNTCYGNLAPGYSLTTLGGDCDDNDITVWRTIQFYVDNDGDGYTENGNFAFVCAGTTITFPPGYNTITSLGPDCNDNDNTLWQGGLFYIDNDDDGAYGSLQSNCFGAVLPPHYYRYDGTWLQDCDDNNNLILGGTLYYADTDGDGYGNINNSTYICGADHTGYVLDNSDCDDTNANIHPGAIDICNNGIDEDCNGIADDQPITYYADTDVDGYGDATVSIQTCDATHAGYVSNNTDCDDTNVDIHPGLQEIDQNGIDDNCDGLIDTRKLFRDSDNDGYGNLAESRTDGFYPGYYIDSYFYVLDSTDCNDNNASIHPGAQELCDGLDNDCNGIVDDNVSPTYAYIDRDGDGYSDFSLFQVVNCDAGTYTIPPGYILYTGGVADCDDNNTAINPGAIENLNNGIDDNCDGLTDVLPNNCDWNGSVSSNWQHPANWDCNQVPTGITIVNVPVVTNQPQLTADAAVFKLISIYGATVDLNGHKLSMSGESNGAIFKGSPSSSLVYQNAGSGSIVMDQTNDGTSNTLAILKYNTSSSGVVQLLNKLIITDSIVPTKGRLYTYSGELVIRSTPTKTASILQGSNGGNYIYGQVSVERYIPNNNFRSWRLLSVPTYGSSQTIRQAWQEGDANPNPMDNNIPNYGTQITGTGSVITAQANGFDNVAQNAGMLYWTGAGWNGVSSTNNAIDQKQAYFLYIRGERSKGVSGAVSNSSATTLRTRGFVYMGNQAMNVAANSFTLVPNLYASAIDFTGLTRTGVNNLFYIWDSKKQNGNSLGVYQTFSNTNSFNCLVSGGSYVLGEPNTLVESGQAFFVQGNSIGGSITLHESSKRAGSTGLGFRPAPSSSIIKLQTSLYNDNDSTMRDANTIVFDANYNNAIDKEDAPKIGNPGENFVIENSSKLLAIEGRNALKEDDVIQFRMWNLKQQQYKLELAAVNMNTEGLTAMIEDSYLKTATAVDLTGTTTLSFKIDKNAASSAANRFRIVFKKIKTEIVDSKQGYSIAPNPVENGIMNLQFKNKPGGKYSLRVTSTAGQVVVSKIIVHTGGNATQVISLPMGMISGHYKVEIIAPDKSTAIVSIMVNRK